MSNQSAWLVRHTNTRWQQSAAQAMRPASSQARRDRLAPTTAATHRHNPAKGTYSRCSARGRPSRRMTLSTGDRKITNHAAPNVMAGAVRGPWRAHTNASRHHPASPTCQAHQGPPGVTSSRSAWRFTGSRLMPKYPCQVSATSAGRQRIGRLPSSPVKPVSLSMYFTLAYTKTHATTTNGAKPARPRSADLPPRARQHAAAASAMGSAIALALDVIASTNRPKTPP